MLSVKELEHSEIPLLLEYWFTADKHYLAGMGVDIDKMPTRQQFSEMMTTQLNTPMEQRRSYCLLWLDNNLPVGHSNTNPSYYGVEATMHLHLWQPATRKKGMGTEFVKLSLPLYFEKLQIKTLWCEPYALNIAPNKTLDKVGFELVKEYTTTPASINFEQPVKQWRMTADRFRTLQDNSLAKDLTPV